MTVEELVKVLDKEVTFEVLQAYDREILFDSTNSNHEWESVKDKIVVKFYPTDTRELYIYVFPDWTSN